MGDQKTLFVFDFRGNSIAIKGNKNSNEKTIFKNLKSNYLKRNGLIVLNFNEEEPGVYFSDELITFFNSENYQVDGNTVLIKSSLTV